MAADPIAELAPGETAVLIHRTTVAGVAHIELFWQGVTGLERSTVDTDPIGLVRNIHALGGTLRPLDEETELELHRVHEQVAW